MRATTFLILSLLLSSVVSAAAQGYYRMPAIYEDTIIFAAEGDLWSVPPGGGLAHRLTVWTSNSLQTSPTAGEMGEQSIGLFDLFPPPSEW